jgi:hypothetical protein
VNALLQSVLVAVLVVACAAFSVWRLMSLTLRLRLLGSLARVPLFADARWLARVRQKLLAGAASACGGCSQADVHQLKPDAVSRNRTPGALRR